MNYGKILSIAMIALSIAACIGYAIAGDTRRAIYWCAASALTASITF